MAHILSHLIHFRWIQLRFDLDGSFFADAVQNLKKKAITIISFILGFIAKNNVLCR